MSSSTLTSSNRFRPLNRVHMKIIAFVTMTIDHIGASFFPGTILFRYIGRIAFPLFAMGIAEGVANTRSHRKYLFRLTLFAFISEIPFNLMHGNRIFDIDLADLQYIDPSFIPKIIHSNVIFTFLAGACICILIDKNLKAWEYPLYTLISVGVLYLNADYGVQGIITVVICYLTVRYKDVHTGPIVAVVVLSLWIASVQMWALLTIIPILLYNGGSGRFNNNAANQVFSAVVYLFYPVHQLIIWLLRYYIIPDAVVWRNIFPNIG